MHDMNGSQNIKLSDRSQTKKYMFYDSIYKNSRKDKHNLDWEKVCR